MRRRTATVVAAVLTATTMVGCSTGDGKASKAEMLEACESDRVIFNARIELMDESMRTDWMEDPTLHWEASQQPVTGAENFYEYDTGVVDITGQMGDLRWDCLYNPKTGDASWGFSDGQTSNPGDS